MKKILISVKMKNRPQEEISEKINIIHKIAEIIFDEELFAIIRNDNDVLEESSTTRRIFEHAIQLYGKDMQLNIAVEEFAELTKEICKHKRGADNTESIVEEIADCYIMLSQLEVIFDLSQETINNAVQKKLKRLEDRIKETIHEAEMHGNFEPIDFDTAESTEDNNFLYNRFMKTE